MTYSDGFANSSADGALVAEYFVLASCAARCSVAIMALDSANSRPFAKAFDGSVRTSRPVTRSYTTNAVRKVPIGDG